MTLNGNIPNILLIYKFCCPNMDFNLRFLPNEGGLYNQYYSDMYWFGIIEERIIDIKIRKEAKNAK